MNDTNKNAIILMAEDDLDDRLLVKDAMTECRWDGDLRFGEAEWNYHSFRGASWCNIKKPERQMYLRNAYRVLLTRARQGMVIFIPRGDTEDPTRMPAFYDSTFNYLAGLGIPIIAS